MDRPARSLRSPDSAAVVPASPTASAASVNAAGKTSKLVLSRNVKRLRVFIVPSSPGGGFAAAPLFFNTAALEHGSRVLDGFERGLSADGRRRAILVLSGPSRRPYVQDRKDRGARYRAVGSGRGMGPAGRKRADVRAGCRRHGR